MGPEIAIARELGSAMPHPIDDAVVRGERCRLDLFYDEAELIGEGTQSALVPPAQVMRRRIEHEIRKVGHCGTPSRHGDIEPPAASGALHQITTEPQRVGDVLDDVKRANGVILLGMGGGMLWDGFVPDIGSVGNRWKMEIEADIGRMRQIARQSAFTAADVEHLLSRSNQFGDTAELGPAEAGSAQSPMEIAASIKVEVELLVAGQHRLEEGEPTGRLPQPEMFDIADLSLGRNSKRDAPQTYY